MRQYYAFLKQGKGNNILILRKYYPDIAPAFLGGKDKLLYVCECNSQSSVFNKNKVRHLGQTISGMKKSLKKYYNLLLSIK
jgi:hypothetical protein